MRHRCPRMIPVRMARRIRALPGLAGQALCFCPEPRGVSALAGDDPSRVDFMTTCVTEQGILATAAAIKSIFNQLMFLGRRMAGSKFQEALRGVAARMPTVVREYEIMRIAAAVGGRDGIKSADAARREVLIWAQKRVGGLLPDQAWSGNDFDHFAGGRNCVGVRITNGGSDIWAIRIDDPDKTVPGRNWTTEVVVGLQPGQTGQLRFRCHQRSVFTSFVPCGKPAETGWNSAM
ncbi:hypothetical protein EV130_110160 [Rhizobium azibense]|uniref:Uncharacterized protein n=1 Tax=Rhizobium azibense TaxID=1136135 RepID=A0A4R3QTF9_9HYPH|nr:hypothetical protein EV130_110160 [Rhizobium azibense]